MVKTQIQLSDEMYRAAKDLAARKEWSLAEVVRRGLEDILCRFPGDTRAGDLWELPAPRSLGGDCFFANPDWRYELNEARGLVREMHGANSSTRARKRK